jgi:hypothetical protein
MDLVIFPRSVYIYWVFDSDKAIQKMGNADRLIWTAYPLLDHVNQSLKIPF